MVAADKARSALRMRAFGTRVYKGLSSSLTTSGEWVNRETPSLRRLTAWPTNAGHACKAKNEQPEKVAKMRLRK